MRSVDELESLPMEVCMTSPVYSVQGDAPFNLHGYEQRLQRRESETAA